MVLAIGATALLLEFAVLSVMAQSADSFAPSLDGTVRALAVQLDGKILAGGDFSGGVRRFNPDGSPDLTFNVAGGATGVKCLAIQPDGKILVGGSFAVFDGHIRNRLARLNADGSLEQGFNPSASSDVNCLVALPNGGILVGGSFGNLAGGGQNFLGRLLEDGTFDPTFVISPNGPVNALIVEDDGDIFIGGDFTQVSGVARTRLARLASDGSLDQGFNATADGTVHCLAARHDGQLWVGGAFTNLNGQASPFLGRFDSSGVLLNPPSLGVNDTVYSLALQANGKIFVGGRFSTLGNLARNRVGRLNADGSGDDTFTPGTSLIGANNTVHAVVIQVDGKVVVGGSFSSLANQARTRLGRLSNNEPVVQEIDVDDTGIVWSRSGAAPEIWHAWFETTTNQIDWTNLGLAVLVGGQWRLNVPGLSTNGDFRALGIGNAGVYSRSTITPPPEPDAPVVQTHPVSRTNNFGVQATFQVSVVGALPITYQWWRGGLPLANGGKISGATNEMLVINNPTRLESAEYWVVASNSFESVTSAVATLTVLDPVITGSQANITINRGQTAGFGVSALGTSSLRYQWRREGTNLPGRTTSSLSLPNVQPPDAARYDVVVTNIHGIVTSAPTRLIVNQSGFDNFSPGLDNEVYAMAVLPDRKVLVGGRFQNTPRRYIARFNADGSPDPSFTVVANGAVFSIAVQEDGKAVLGGWFTTLSGRPRSYIARLNRDGTLDEAFDPGAIGGTQFPGVYSAVVQADGKIVVGGDFQVLGGIMRSNIGRLNSDGSGDPTFLGSADNLVYPMTLQPDGKIIVGGVFSNLSGNACVRLGRLNADGSFDSTFASFASDVPLAMALQPDGKIVVGGVFTRLSGQICNKFGRLNPDGSWDEGFYPRSEVAPFPHGATDTVRTLALQASGDLFAGGAFFQIAGQSLGYLARLQKDGTFNTAFGLSAGYTVYGITIQEDGRILVGDQANLRRITNSEPVISSLTVSNSTINWQRDGSGPGFWRTSFFTSTNGSDWAFAGSGQYSNNTWQFESGALPTNAAVLGRGFVAGGRYGASTWFVDASAGALSIGRHPLSRTNVSGTRALFEVSAGGTAPLTYQWYRNNTKLNNDSSFSGVQTPWLTVNSVNIGNTGNYWVVVSNISGTTTSRMAALSILNPYITLHPVGRTNNAGTPASFSVQAGGSPTVTYRWYLNGVAVTNSTSISGAQSVSLSLSNVYGLHAGSYTFVASNASGMVTSSPAILTVIEPFILSSPSNHTVQLGGATSFAISAAGSALTYQWRKNGQPLPGMTDAIILLNDVTPSQGGPYDVVVSSDFGSRTSSVGVLTVNAAVADAFNPNVSGTVYNLALRPDGRIFVGGSFTNVGGQELFRLAQLHPDGTPDFEFNPVPDWIVRSLQVQPDGGLLVGGYFGYLAAQPRPYLGRFDAGDELDPNFQPMVAGPIFSTVAHRDEKILIVGDFDFVGGQPRSYLARVNADGTLDFTFAPTLSGPVTAVLPLPDGKILVGGNFVTVNGITRSKIARLNPDGTLDPAFNATFLTNGTVYALALQADGRIIVGGNFTISGQQRNLARLEPIGLLDASFRADSDGTISSIALLADGQILVNGFFSELSGLPRNRIGRLKPDGSVEMTFDPQANDIVYSIVPQGDGRILVMGDFTELGGKSRSGVGRIDLGETATQTLIVVSNLVHWSRTGAVPEILEARFAYSTNQLDWIEFAKGERMSNGWSAALPSVPPDSTIRASGIGVGGYRGGSSWGVQSFHSPTTNHIGVPVILVDDGHFGVESNHFGFTLAAASGSRILVESSTNLLDWLPLWTNAPGSGPWHFRDVENIGLPSRFYRAKLAP